MQKDEMEQLITAVAQRVLATLQAQEASQKASQPQKPSILVIGKTENVPQTFASKGELTALSAYASCRDIKRFGMVVIESLTLCQLADLAMARPSDEACCAVTQALLRGVEVVLLESALSHRAYAGQGSSKLFAVLEGYVRTLETYGVKVICKDTGKAAEKPSKACEKAILGDQGQASAVKKPQLITEAVARTMAAKEHTIHLETGVILTPSARDVFLHAKTVLIWDD